MWLLHGPLNIDTLQFQASVVWIKGLPVSSGPFSALCLMKSYSSPKHNLPLEPSSVLPTVPGEPSLHSPKELVSSCKDCSKLGMGKHCVFSAEQRLSVSHQIRLPPQEWDPLLPHLRENSLQHFTEHLKHAVMSETTVTVGRTLIMHIIETSVFLSP